MSVGTTSPESARKSGKRYRENPQHKKLLRASWAVQSKLRSGELKKPKACTRCGRSGVRLVFHHTDKTYKKGSRLTGKFVCDKCHAAIDSTRSGKAMSKARAKAEKTKKREGTYKLDGSKKK